jgi:predicted nucleotidyltransferase
MKFPHALSDAVTAHPYPLLFATISGAHLYGFPSQDSDYDLRGTHILPVAELVGLEEPRETIEISNDTQGIELDLVTHDIKKFFLLLLKKNGYVLEQLYSPLIVHTCDEHSELKEIAKNCITRHHSHHYFGFSDTQWRLFQKEEPKRIKPLLYVYRVLLTGIHLMRTGTIEANLVTLNEEFQLPYIQELVNKKQSAEHQSLGDADLEFHRAEYERLRKELEAAFAASRLPESPSAESALSDLLKRIRLNFVQPT